MRHASSRSSGIGRFYNLLYNFWPELSVLGLRFVKRSCRLTCDTRDVTGKVMPSPFVLLMSSFRVLTMVVLLLPQKILLVLSSKQYLIAFVAGQSAGSLRMHPSSFHLLSVMVIDSDFVSVILCSLLLDILCDKITAIFILDRLIFWY